MTRAVALLRVSTPKQDPARQRAMLERWCAWREIPLSSVDIRDEGAVSGASSDRKVLDTLLEDVRCGRVDTLIVSELDRLGRGLVDLVLNWHTINAAGTKLVTLSSGREFDPKTAEGKLEFHMLAVLADYVRNRIKQQTTSSLDGGKNAAGLRVSVYGNVLGQRPWRVDEAQLAAIPARHAAGETCAEIAASLSAWKPVKDKATGEWTEAPVQVSAEWVRRRVKGAR